MVNVFFGMKIKVGDYCIFFLKKYLFSYVWQNGWRKNRQ